MDSISNNPKWKKYEQVATYLLNEFATHFGLGHVEGKQLIAGASGTKWEIDAKATLVEGQGFLVVECRRYKLNLPQIQLAGLAFVINDTQASGGLIVTPVDLQLGAAKVAAHANIQHVRLSADSTTTDYLIEFLGRSLVGASIVESIGASDDVSCVVIRSDGSSQ
jgi:hypothetical protein